MYINYETALKYTYSEELLSRVIARFLEEYKNLDLKMLELEKSKVLMLIHKIKGITLNVGAEELYKKCIEVETSKKFDESLKSFIYTFNKSYNELLNFKGIN